MTVIIYNKNYTEQLQQQTKEVLNGYVVKELQASKTFHIDSDRIFTSKTLFNL